MEWPIFQAAQGFPTPQVLRGCREPGHDVVFMHCRERGLVAGEPEEPGEAAAAVVPPIGCLQCLDDLDGIQVRRMRGTVQHDRPVRNPERAQTGGPASVPAQEPRTVQRDFQNSFAIGRQVKSAAPAEAVEIFQPERIEQVLGQSPGVRMRG